MTARQHEAPDCAGRNGVHTPGPWHYSETATHVTVRNENNDAVFHDDKRIPGVVRDARLIAAAPEMLEALQSIVIAIPQVLRDELLLDAIEDIIARATGAA